MEIWRDSNLNAGSNPTVSTSPAKTIDLVRKENGVNLKIAHVLTINGKGFKPIISDNFISETGEITMGTDRIAYDKALAEGEIMLKKELLKRKQVWRDDYHPKEMATINFHTIHASDRIEEKDIFTLWIYHVTGFHGRGFIAKVISGGSLHSGKIHYGEDQATYNKALLEGQEILEQEITKFAEQLAEQEELAKRKKQ